MFIPDNEDYQIAFGQWIKAARERKDLFQSEIAAQLKIRQSYYSMIENGQRNVDLGLALRICKILGLDIGDFNKQYMK